MSNFGPESDSGKTERRGFLKAAAGASVGIVAGALAADAESIPGSKDQAEAKRLKTRRQGFCLPFASNDPELGRRFVDDPEGVLKQMNLPADSLACPSEVHQAFQRGQECVDEFEKELSGTKQTPLDLISVARRVIPKHLGEDYQVTIQPFGLQFRERIPMHELATLGSTISGTVSVTFLDKDVDVDD